MKFFLQKSCGPKKPDATQSEITKIAPFISKQTNKALRILSKQLPNWWTYYCPQNTTLNMS